MDDDELDDAERQRRTIVAKYDRVITFFLWLSLCASLQIFLFTYNFIQGYKPNELEEWEDASYIVYQVTDRYGFMQQVLTSRSIDHTDNLSYNFFKNYFSKEPLSDDRDAKVCARIIFKQIYFFSLIQLMFFSWLQLLIQERERELKWKKMVEKWTKYAGNDKVKYTF